ARGAAPPPALVLLAIVSVQVGAALAKQLFPVAGPGGVVAMRLVFAALLLLALWRPTLRFRGRAGRRGLLAILAFGTVTAAMNISIYESFSRIPLGIAVTIEFLGPLAVALFGSRRPLDVAWAVLAAAGVLLLTGGRGDGGVEPLGVLFALCAAACWAAYILLSAVVGSRTQGGGGLALAMVWGALLVAPFGAADAGVKLLDPPVLLVGLVVALLSSVVPYSLELEALRRIPPRVFGVLMSLEPAVAAVAGLVILGEYLGAVQWLAIACVVVASAGATRW
ncbi:MAG: EamA family transporter, partial [Streptomycetales bacterium]